MHAQKGFPFESGSDSGFEGISTSIESGFLAKFKNKRGTNLLQWKREPFLFGDDVLDGDHQMPSERTQHSKSTFSILIFWACVFAQLIAWYYIVNSPPKSEYADILIFSTLLVTFILGCISAISYLFDRGERHKRGEVSQG